MAEKFAIVTGASTGIGFELASIAAENGYDLLVVANEPLIEAAGRDFETHGVSVSTVEADLATIDGVDKLLAATQGRRIDLLCANAGHGLGHSFLEQEPSQWRHVVDTNITGTLYLTQQVLKEMVARNDGKILVTGSIAGFLPGSFHAVYNGTKAFVDSFFDAVRDEIKDSPGVTITTLMPGVTDTEFFERANMGDTSAGSGGGEDAAKVAETGWSAMERGKAHVVSGWKNKIQAALAHVTPAAILAHQHRNMAAPGTGE